jgi:hypothetical protein
LALDLLFLPSTLDLLFQCSTFGLFFLSSALKRLCLPPLLELFFTASVLDFLLPPLVSEFFSLALLRLPLGFLLFAPPSRCHLRSSLLLLPKQFLALPALHLLALQLTVDILTPQKLELLLAK